MGDNESSSSSCYSERATSPEASNKKSRPNRPKLLAKKRLNVPKPSTSRAKTPSSSSSDGDIEGTVSHQVKMLREEYLLNYVQPESDKLPYNRNMARSFGPNSTLPPEEQQRRRQQAEASLVSRDRTRFADKCLREEHDQLEKILHDSIKELYELEKMANEYLVRNGAEPIDWDSESGLDDI